MKNCTKCGSQMSDDAMFCTNCGASAEQAAPVNQATPAADPFAAAPVNQAASNADPFAAAPVNQAAPTADPFAAAPVNQAASNADPFAAAPVNQAAPAADPFAAAPANQAAPKKKNGKKKIIIGSIIAAVAVITAIVITLLLVFGGNEKLALKDFIKLETSGYDTYGTASAVFDTTKFQKALAEKLDIDLKNVKKSDSDAQSMLKILTLLSASMDYELDKSDNLSNGDTVTVTFTLSDKVIETIEDEGLELDTSDYTKEISGLDEIKTVDVFDKVSVTVEGIYPNLTVEIENGNTDSYLSDLYFTCEDIENPEDGVTVTIDSYNDPQYSGYEFTEKEKTYPIEKYKTYIYTKDEVKESDLEEYKTAAEGYVDEWFDDNDIYYDATDYKDLTFIGYSLCTPKRITKYSDGPSIYLIYSIETIPEDSADKPETVYLIYKINSVYYDMDSDSIGSDLERQNDYVDDTDDYKDYLDSVKGWNNCTIDTVLCSSEKPDGTEEESTSDEASNEADTTEAETES